MSNIKLKDVLKFENSFCVLPFIHKYIDFNARQKLCCHSKDSINNSRLQEVRTLMLNNQPVPECLSCLQKEQTKTFSKRQLYNKEWMRAFPNLDFHCPQELSYDLRFSNLCNLRCQMCGPTSSSEWAKHLGKTETYKNIEPDLNINPKAKRIYLAGGEPFMIKSFSTLLDSIENIECEIIINTNATIITDHMMNALQRFKNICFVLSIDGTGKTIERIRTLCSWEIIQNNVKILKDKLNPNLMVNTVIQKDNIDNIPELAKWIDDTDIKVWHVTILTEPKDFRFQNYNGVLSWDKKLWHRNCVKNNIQCQDNLKYIQDYFS